MTLYHGDRYSHGRPTQQLFAVRDVSPEEDFKHYLANLKHILDGRVSIAPVRGLAIQVANLSTVRSINRVQRKTGGAVDKGNLSILNTFLASEKPTVAARVRDPDQPLYVEGSELKINFSLDPEVLRRAASAAIAAYCGEAVPVEHKAFAPLAELGCLTLGRVHPAYNSTVRLNPAAYRHFGFASASEMREFCEDPNGYIDDLGVVATAPGSLAFGPMHVVCVAPEGADFSADPGVGDVQFVPGGTTK